MLRNIEKVSKKARLHLTSNIVWSCDQDWPHIANFKYDVSAPQKAGEERRSVGQIDGYRITQDWTVQHALNLWDEADALDGDVLRYVEALIVELRACELVFGFAPDLTTAQRITIVRHFQANEKPTPAKQMQAVISSVAMMDAPVLMLVDPWPMAGERRTPAGKLAGRKNFPELLKVGFVRMVGSRFLWAWNHELSESLMAEYSYEKLLEAKKDGRL